METKEKDIIFYHLKERITFDKIYYTEDEFLSVIKEIKPKYFYIYQWATNIPLYTVVGEYEKNGITITCASWVNETPRFYSFQQFYKLVKNYLADLGIAPLAN